MAVKVTLMPVETAMGAMVEEHIPAVNMDRRLVLNMVTLEIEPAYRRRRPAGHQIRSTESLPLLTEINPAWFHHLPVTLHRRIRGVRIPPALGLVH
jgi:hypothetical protein